MAQVIERFLAALRRLAPAVGDPIDHTTLPSTRTAAANRRTCTPLDAEAGLATAEYAVATIAAVGFAALLIVVLKSDAVRSLLEGIITTALTAF